MELRDRLSAAALIRSSLYNARRIAKGEFKRKPNWAMAMELWAVGSTYAREYCRIAQVDPDATGGFDLWAPNFEVGRSDRDVDWMRKRLDPNYITVESLPKV